MNSGSGVVGSCWVEVGGISEQENKEKRRMSINFFNFLSWGNKPVLNCREDDVAKTSQAKADH